MAQSIIEFEAGVKGVSTSDLTEDVALAMRACDNSFISRIKSALPQNSPSP